MIFSQGLKKIGGILTAALIMFSAVPAVENNAVFTGTPVVEFIRDVKDMSSIDRGWIRDNILNPLKSDSSLVSIKANELKGRFPSVSISTADVEAALGIFADTDAVIQDKVINHLVSGEKTVQYTAGSFDTLKNKIQANVGSLENLVSALILLQDITNLDPLFTDKNAEEGTIKPNRTVTGDMVGGNDILDKLDQIIQTITGVHFASLNLVLAGYADVLNSAGTAAERINFEKFLFTYGTHNSRHLYEGTNAHESKRSSSSKQEDVEKPKPPVSEDSDKDGKVIKTVSTVSADEKGSVVISNEQADQIIENIKSLAQSTASAPEDDTKTKLVIAVQAQSSLSQTEVKIPASIIKEVENKKIDLIEVKTSVAEIVVPSSSLQAAGASSIDVSAKAVDKEKELTAEQRAVVGDNPVYDFKITAVTSSGTTNIRSFEGGIQIAVPYILKPGDDPEKITIFYLNENNEPENMQGVYDAVSGTVSFTTMHLSKYYIKVNNVTFNDLEKYQWAKQYVESMSAKGIISGKAEGLYYPGDNITRAEFTALLVKLFKIKDSGKALTFKDVKADAWYYNAAVTAFEQGIITGRDAQTFAPDENISRQDMAVMIERVLKKYKKAVSPEGIKLDFKDSGKVSDYAREGIALTVKYGIIKGNDDNTFRPLNNATRAEAAAVIYRIFNMK